MLLLSLLLVLFVAVAGVDGHLTTADATRDNATIGVEAVSFCKEMAKPFSFYKPDVEGHIRDRVVNTCLEENAKKRLHPHPLCSKGQNFDPSNAKVLIFSDHAQIVDMAEQFRAAGVKRENVHCIVTRYYAFILKGECEVPPLGREMATFLNDLSPVTRLEATHNWTVVPDGFFIQEFAEMFGDRLREYDVILVGLPAIFGVLIQAVAPEKLWLRLMHRFDHETGVNSPSRFAVRQLVKSAWHVVSSSDYDSMYAQYYACRVPVHLPMFCLKSYLVAGGKYHAEKSKPVFLLWGGASGVEYPSIAHVYKYFASDAPELKDLPFEIIHARKYTGKGGRFKDVSDFSNVLGIIYYPYSVISGAFHDLYSSTIPMIVPSKQYIINEHAQGRGMDHHCANNMLCSDPSYEEDGSCHHGELQHHDPNSCKEEDLKVWMQYSDIVQWPSVLTFDSLPTIVHLMKTLNDNRTMLQELSAGMEKQVIELRNNSTATITRLLEETLCTSGADTHKTLPFARDQEQVLNGETMDGLLQQLSMAQSEVAQVASRLDGIARMLGTTGRLQKKDKVCESVGSSCDASSQQY